GVLGHAHDDAQALSEPGRRAHPHEGPASYGGVMARDPSLGSPVGRRVFLGLLAVGAVGVLFGSRAQDWLEREVGPLISKEGAALARLLPIGRFRIYTVTGSLPSRSRAEYRLRVRGLVDRELDLSYDDLVAMTPTAMTRDFQCVTGWRVHEVQWKGVR